MTYAELKQSIISALHEAVKSLYAARGVEGEVPVLALERPADESHGDFASNIALQLGGRLKAAPAKIAGEIAARLQKDSLVADGLCSEVATAGPGFINFRVSNKILWESLRMVLGRGPDCGTSRLGQGKKVLLEFVSANPTGPLTIGHGRQAAIGDTLAHLLQNIGYSVEREYYFNNAGRQMTLLAESVRVRYRELHGETAEFPEDGYQGEYIKDIASTVSEGTTDIDRFKEIAEGAIFGDIKNTLMRMGIEFDNYFNEDTLYKEGRVDDAVARLRKQGHAYEKDEAVWLRATAFGCAQDRVIIKSSGEPTYRLPDICYHEDKLKRGYDRIIDIFGADHHATVPDVMAGLKALGHDTGRITVLLHQFVTLVRDGKPVKMSTRKANFVTLDELLDEVGSDAARYFFVMRSIHSHLDFDLELAKKHTLDNPVYYVQYAHARICSIYKTFAEQGGDVADIKPDTVDVSRLEEADELRMIKTICRFPEVIRDSALNCEPHRLTTYLEDLASQFHSYYNRCRIVTSDTKLTRARLALVIVLRTVFKNGLEALGVTAPEKM